MTAPIRSILNSPPPARSQQISSLSSSSSSIRSSSSSLAHKSQQHGILGTQQSQSCSGSNSSSSTSISSLNTRDPTTFSWRQDGYMERLVGPPMILINGFPCTGKFTIANELSNILNGAKVFDKHILIDTATKVFDKTDVEYQALRKALRSTILHAVTTSPTNHPNPWIFTETQSSSTLGTSITHEYLTFAKQRRPLPSPFISIILTCSIEENIKRLLCKHSQSNNSGGGTNANGSQDSDIATLKIIRQEEEIHRFGEWAGVYEKVIDVTTLGALEAAEAVKEFIEEVLRNISSH